MEMWLWVWAPREVSAKDTDLGITGRLGVISKALVWTEGPAEREPRNEPTEGCPLVVEQDAAIEENEGGQKLEGK